MERLFFPREIADNNHPAVVGCVIVLCIHDLIFNPLSPNSDQHLISPHNITDSSTIHVTRMNEMITKDGMS